MKAEALKILIAGLATTALLPVMSFADPLNGNGQIIATQQSLMDAMNHEEMDLFHRVTCSGFYLFEGGQVIRGDEVMHVIKGLHSSGNTFVWKITQPDVHIDHNTAWMTYTNQGSITKASGKQDMSWLESVVMNRTAKGWCIAFSQSARVPSKP